MQWLWPRRRFENFIFSFFQVTQLRPEADVSLILETQSDGDCPEFIVRFAYDGKKKLLRPLLDPTAFEELTDDETEAPVSFPDWISRDLDYFEG